MNERYISAKDAYVSIGVDTEAAMRELAAIPISIHCWQGDDVTGFEGDSHLTGGIQVTGNYPGRARTPEELMADIDMALGLIPGRHRLNLHASYAIFQGHPADRDELAPRHFKLWVEFARQRGLGLDFNPTFFSHPKSQHATLSSEDSDIRAFWIKHCRACIKIAEYFAAELGTPSLLDIWIPDGFKEIPADRTGPRARLKDSLDQILSISYDKTKVLIAVESKVFGIGMESYTVGSHEFYMNYAAKNNILCLLDNGHYHPTESVADKIPSMLLFSDKVALHVTRSVRWDSDHVILLNDEIKEIAREIIQAGTDRVILATDFFDASVNRIAAWAIGVRSLQKALLNALLTPHDRLRRMQDERRFTELLMLEEEFKLLPIGDVWNRFCAEQKVQTDQGLYDRVAEYEKLNVRV
jgi:L-rhamnose isomerase